MITSAFIYLGAYIVNMLLYPFPLSDGLPSEATSAISSLAGYINILSPIIPISTILQLIALMITLELAFFSFKAFRWIISHVPLVGGRA